MDPKQPDQTIGTDKKNYSLKKKQALFTEWKHSGLTVRRFAKIHNIASSSMYKWCKELSPQCDQKTEDKKEDNNKCNWLPVMSAPSSAIKSPNEPMLIELGLAQQLTARIKIQRTEAINFLQELYHAITVIR
jgi:transposase-like protein